MEAKIKATMAERLNAETLICVRTDARAVLGFDEALRRAPRWRAKRAASAATQKVRAPDTRPEPGSSARDALHQGRGRGDLR
jgi:hypothetical protein